MFFLDSTYSSSSGIGFHLYIPGNSSPGEEIGKVLSVAETYACYLPLESETGGTFFPEGHLPASRGPTHQCKFLFPIQNPS